MRIFLFIFLAVALCSCKRPNHDHQRSSSPLPETNYSDKGNRSSRRVTTISRASGHNQVKMKPMGGVYEIPTKINGVNMDFIFDTGASNISISETEVLFLIKQGKLTKEDVLGSTQFSDATGNVSEGTVINLRTVQIGNRLIKNVEASVVHNSTAPLLLGQSALAQFGKVTIDYKNNTLSFE